MKNTYKMYYKCYNCDKIFKADVPKKTLVTQYVVGVCPYCKAEGEVKDKGHKCHIPLPKLTNVTKLIEVTSVLLIIGGAILLTVVHFI